MWEELSPVESNVEDLFELLQMILSRLYVSSRKNIQRSHEFAGEFFMNLPDDEFKRLTQMTSPAFDRVCREIHTHRVFQNNSNNKQAPVWLQFAVGLDRLGNGASTGRKRLAEPRCSASPLASRREPCSRRE
ncbi:hypothetical protein L914_10435 [Phytophthora nicotianae]|uniref:Uncharacterized protein n=1 Tax=Phytophthora nicotianae TaxID=4792 RepID=W2N8W9_PHYNI|nr:hypothetical protein L914_10435 [Phytophthora nicotianae]